MMNSAHAECSRAGLECNREPAGGGQDRIALGEALTAGDLKRIEQELNLNYAKWDTRVGGGQVLSAQPVLLRADEWKRLCGWAEAAARELLAIEREIALNEAMQELIGVPRKLRRFLSGGEAAEGFRTFRFDFHPTTTGWAISEVNSDVPGGFGEASVLPGLYGVSAGALPLPFDPLKRWGDAVEARIRGGTAALLCAPGFLEDQQVVRTLARELRERGFKVHLIQSPFALRWKNGCASLRGDSGVPLDLLVRFYQVEWLSELPGWMGWKKILGACGRTVVTNSAIAAITESKRLGLCAKRLTTRSETLQRLMPECREPAEISGMPKDDWVLKAAYSNTGDEVYLGSHASVDGWAQLIAKAKRNPRGWVAQRRFETTALRSTSGEVKPCVGVFVIGGQAAGAYVRLSRMQVTDGDALEAPLFLMQTEEDG